MRMQLYLAPAQNPTQKFGQARSRGLHSDTSSHHVVHITPLYSFEHVPSQIICWCCCGHGNVRSEEQKKHRNGTIMRKENGSTSETIK